MRKKLGGLTLIELIIVTAVIGIMAAIGSSTFLSYSRTQKLQTAANDLVTVLNVAKSNSFSQLISFPTTNCLNKRLDGYEVIITIPSSYKINVVCSGVTVDRYQVLAKSLPNNIEFDPISQTFFFFPVLTGGVIGSGTVQLSGFGQTRSVTVTNAGVIK